MESNVPGSVEPAVRVARGASYLVLQGIVINLIAVVYFVFATRLLTIADFGRITTANLFILMVVAVGSLGLPTAATRFIAKYLAREESDRVQAFYRRTVKLGLFFSMLSLIAVFAGSETVSRTLLGSSSYTALFELGAFDVFLQLITLFPISALSGTYRFREVAIVNILSNLVQFSAAVYLLTLRMGLVGIMIGWIIGDGLGTGLAFLIASKNFPLSGEIHTRFNENLFQFALPLYGTTLVQYASLYVDRYLVLFFAGTSALGIYTPVVTTVSILGLVSTAMTGAFLPQFSALHARRGEKGLQEAARVGSRYFFIIYLPLAVGLAVVAAPAITLFAGERYADGAFPLAIIAIGLGLTSASAVINTLLMVLGRTRVLLVASIFGVLTDVALSPLIILLGVTGAALGRVALLVGSLLVSWVALGHGWSRRIVDLKAFYEVLMCCLIEAAVVVMAELVIYDKHLLGWYMASGFLAYFISLRALRIVKQYDIGLLHRFMPSRLQGVVTLFGWLMSAHSRPVSAAD